MITSHSARIETARILHRNEYAWMDVTQVLSGFGFQIRFMPSDGGYYCVCTRETDPHQMFIVAAPSSEWKQDIKDAGYTIIQDLKMTEQLVKEDSK